MATYRIDIAGHTSKLNELLGDWRRAARRKKADRQLVALACLAARVPKAEGKRRVGLTVVLGPRMRGADPDAFWKSLLDGCVLCGVLKGDSKEWVELKPVAYERGERAAMVVTLEDVEEGK